MTNYKAIRRIFAALAATSLTACGEVPDLRGGDLNTQFGHAAYEPPQPPAPDYRVQNALIDEAVLQALDTPQAAQPSVLEDPTLEMQRVAYHGDRPVHTILIDDENLKLYYIDGPGTAIQYPVAMGRTGAEMPDVEYYVDRTATWPNWYPTANMRENNPSLPRVVEGGPDNPLGAAALYLSDANGATLYRIHGTSAPESIGTNASSGCVRLFNDHIQDLHGRVPDPSHVRITVEIAEPHELQFSRLPQGAMAYTRQPVPGMGG